MTAEVSPEDYFAREERVAVLLETLEEGQREDLAVWLEKCFLDYADEHFDQLRLQMFSFCWGVLAERTKNWGLAAERDEVQMGLRAETGTPQLRGNRIPGYAHPAVTADKKRPACDRPGHPPPATRREPRNPRPPTG